MGLVRVKFLIVNRYYGTSSNGFFCFDMLPNVSMKTVDALLHHTVRE
jgi:hypothetical protein